MNERAKKKKMRATRRANEGYIIRGGDIKMRDNKTNHKF